MNGTHNLIIFKIINYVLFLHPVIFIIVLVKIIIRNTFFRVFCCVNIEHENGQYYGTRDEKADEDGNFVFGTKSSRLLMIFFYCITSHYKLK